MTTFINVPFSEKNDAKALGARWDSGQQSWYVPEGIDLSAFSRWLPKILSSQKSIQRMSQDSLVTENSGNKKAKTLHQFMSEVTLIIKNGFPGPEWIQVEVSKVSERSGHVYLDLVEYGPDSRELAKSRAAIWAGKKNAVLGKFKEATGGGIQDGMKLLLLMKPEFSQQFGFSFVVEDVDPSFTLGEMAAKIKKIRDALIKSGLYTAQKKLQVPFDFFSVAVVSPENAAGLADFMREADAVQGAGLCNFTYYSATFQGESASKSITRAFSVVMEDHQHSTFDAIVFIRGGGAAADLAWLNDQNIAEAICKSGVPVFTGIGHQIDDTILDEVAFRRFDTPSKVSAYIAATIVENAQKNEQNMTSIHSDSMKALIAAEAKVESMLVQVGALANQAVIRSENFIKERLQSIKDSANRQVAVAEERIKSAMVQVMGLSPKSTLQRGYAVIRAKDGSPISSAAAAIKGQAISIELRDGLVNAEII